MSAEWAPRTTTGIYARQTGAMAGIDIPSTPVEHQFIVTEAHETPRKRKAGGIAPFSRPPPLWLS